MRVKKNIIGLGLSFFVLMAPYSQAGIITDDAKVTFVGTYGDGRLFVALDKTIDDPVCPKARFDVEPNNPNIKYWLSIAMTALSTGKYIRVSTSGCYSSHPTLGSSGTDTWFYIKQ